MHIAILSACVGFGAYITGVFGMNLDQVNFIIYVDGIFYGIFAASFALIFGLFFSVISYFKSIGVLPKSSSSTSAASSSSPSLKYAPMKKES